jgi:AcrR family transcriptional regulator
MSPRNGITLETILETAAKLVDRIGAGEMTLALLARELGIRSPSLYNHVQGLDDLKTKLAVYGLKQLYERMVDASVGKSQDEAVRSMARAYVDFARHHPGLYEATFHSPDPSDPDVTQMNKNILDIVIKVFRGYSLDEETTLHMVRGVRSLLHGFSSLDQKGGFNLDPDPDESLNMMIDTFLAGIRSIKK